jgi:hypothetical protein
MHGSLAVAEPLGFFVVVAIGVFGAVVATAGWFYLRRRDHRHS